VHKPTRMNVKLSPNTVYRNKSQHVTKYKTEHMLQDQMTTNKRKTVNNEMDSVNCPFCS